jgi:hypothetical protein
MSTPTRDDVLAALAPVLDVVRGVDPKDPQATQKLQAALPPDGPLLRSIGALVRAGVAGGTLATRDNNGVRFERVAKADAAGGWSIDVVHMSGPALGHTHPNGEVDLCFAVDGSPRFDGHAPGWVVYGENTWHVPTVDGGAMDILYFLPQGAIRFEDKPA